MGVMKTKQIHRREFLTQTAAVGVALPLVSETLMAAQKKPVDGENADSRHLVLWYDKPASQWVEAAPIGNGRLGAMVFGGVPAERLQLNEDTLYAGGPYDPNNREALRALPEARRLIFEGKYQEAHDLVGARMMANPIKQMPYQPIGDFRLEYSGHTEVSNYRRELNLDTAIARISYAFGGVTFNREIFASPVDQVIVVNLIADRSGQISFAATFTTPQKAAVETAADSLILRGENREASGVKSALKFQARALVLANGGRMEAENGKIVVSNANSALILISAATSYKGFNDVSGDPEALVTECLKRAKGKSLARLRDSHVREHQRLFRRVTLDLGITESAKLPTDMRPAKFLAGSDPHLAALYFQYGRYLLISSSRPGTQPANLQGIWNESMTPPWDSKYTLNINAEMNYWPAEVTNLSECHEPLLRMTAELVENGSRTARVQYGANGWVCHHNTDAWRATAPIDGPFWGFWPAGGAWLCTHLWNHYEFTGDKEFLARSYPVIKSAAQFFIDTLVEEPKHKWLVTCPSLSPENAHPARVAICAGPTMDMQILRDLFSQCVRAAADSWHRYRLLRESCCCSCATGADASRQSRSIAGMARRLGYGSARTATSSCLASLWFVSQQPDHGSRNAGAFQGSQKDSGIARRRRHGLESGLENQPLGKTARRRACLSPLAKGIDAGQFQRRERPGRWCVSESFRCSSAISNRRQFRRDFGNRRDASAVAHGRDSFVAGVAEGVASRNCERVARARRL